jgi:hypothetical protein
MLNRLTWRRRRPDGGGSLEPLRAAMGAGERLAVVCITRREDHLVLWENESRRGSVRGHFLRL